MVRAVRSQAVTLGVAGSRFCNRLSVSARGDDEESEMSKDESKTTVTDSPPDHSSSSLPPASLIDEWHLNNHAEPVDHDRVMMMIEKNLHAMAVRLPKHVNYISKRQG